MFLTVMHRVIKLPPRLPLKMTTFVSSVAARTLDSVFLGEADLFPKGGDHDGTWGERVRHAMGRAYAISQCTSWQFPLLAERPNDLAMKLTPYVPAARDKRVCPMRFVKVPPTEAALSHMPRVCDPFLG